ncbi:cytochrome-c oxidase, cbb3-type subunit III [Oceanimonas sp. CAM02]|uniref:cytochrome-c oxidase, cbb3-type subunit III n=1 Tax=Oceanimonas sp. CAM02 TaxID=3080336 RepID=UPI0029358AEF|nr:cytochrome-c oxidase, cbb3-type subunit III [Oceanimonas sp. CAM02]MDV2856921.1 cytochrome-c oxidase, cbb3-type subunit III [Oceanimonas sp. CAM02]
MNTFLSIFVTVISLGTIFGCLTLLIWCTKDKMGMEEGAPTGHTFDGISELNNPLPKWWSYMFVFMIVFSLIYLVLYPGLGNFKGILGWESSNQDVRSLEESRAASAAAREEGRLVQYEREMVKADEVFGAKFRELVYEADGETYRAIADIAQDKEATKVGQRLYLQNCAQCHGSDARGARGFPNLTDGDWLWGGSPEAIKHTIVAGRKSAGMAAWGPMLGEEGVQEVASYVLSLSGRKVDPVEAQKGQARFGICAGCHGVDGKGNPALGAPNLTDNIWLYGGSRAAVEDSIRNGRAGVMPAWNDILGEDKVHLLASYVYSLSNEQ